MTDDRFFLLAVIWVAFVIAASIVYRRHVGKPIFPKIAANARYAERWASGPFASNCLMIWLTDEALTVVPRFPFNLMFLPEFYRLERTIPLTKVREVIGRRLVLGNNVILRYGEGQTLRLRLRQPDIFIEVLRQLVPSLKRHSRT